MTPTGWGRSQPEVHPHGPFCHVAPLRVVHLHLEFMSLPSGVMPSPAACCRPSLAGRWRAGVAGRKQLARHPGARSRGSRPAAIPLLAVLVLALVGLPWRRVRAQADPRPTLIVFLTVDQLRPDYFTRFGAQLTGGLGRLSRGGAVFTHAYQDHAVTETAPGHASTLAGRFPAHTGIVLNSLGVEGDPEAPLLGGGGPSASPFRFRGSTLIDWMRLADPRSRALSISRKNRGAILPLGRAHQEVYWYAEDGRFTTSAYYHDTLPTWVVALNALRVPQRHAGVAWTPLLPASAYPEPDSVPVESTGRDFVFPHVAPADTAAAARQFVEYPWMDSLTLAGALRGARAMRLGAGPAPDLLAVSLSTTDAVGHRYGPDSKELHDQILRLDRALGAFLDSLYAMRDSSRVVVALTADHGMTPFPGVRSADPNQRGRFLDPAALAAPVRAALAARGVPAPAFQFGEGLVTVDRAALTRAGVAADSLLRAFAATLRATPGIARVDRPADLARADTVRDAIARRWLHMLPPDVDVPLVVTAQPFVVWGSGSYATHGSPNDLDAHVPVLFYGAPFRPGQYAEFARVVDMAPTLARILGVVPTERLDGHVLARALRRSGAAAPRAAPSR